MGILAEGAFRLAITMSIPVRNRRTEILAILSYFVLNCFILKDYQFLGG